jgi:hypothetical protein
MMNMSRGSVSALRVSAAQAAGAPASADAGAAGDPIIPLLPLPCEASALLAGGTIGALASPPASWIGRDGGESMPASCPTAHETANGPSSRRWRRALRMEISALRRKRLRKRGSL